MRMKLRSSLISLLMQYLLMKNRSIRLKEVLMEKSLDTKPDRLSENFSNAQVLITIKLLLLLLNLSAKKLFLPLLRLETGKFIK